jgi:hypothetical protein
MKNCKCFDCTNYKKTLTNKEWRKEFLLHSVAPTLGLFLGFFCVSLIIKLSGL